MCGRHYRLAVGSNLPRLALIVIALNFAGNLKSQESIWKTKDPAEWRREDALQVLRNSPWAREIEVGIARRLTEDQLREGGEMGQPRGVGNEGIDPKGSGPQVSLDVLTGPGGNDRSRRSLPGNLRLRIVWESALPIRLAELKTQQPAPFIADGEGYQIAVYGIPGPSFRDDPQKFGNPLRESAALQRLGKKDVRPERVEVFQRPDGLAAVYLFPPSAEITPNDVQVRFEARIGRVIVSHIFTLQDMQFLGRLML